MSLADYFGVPVEIAADVRKRMIRERLAALNTTITIKPSLEILPTGESPLVSLYDYADGEFSLYNHWDTGRVRLRIERSGNTQLIESDGGLSTSSEERIAVRYVDNPSGAGGTVNRAVDAAATEQALVGGVDDGVDVERGDVADLGF